MFLYKLNIPNLTKHNADLFEKSVREISGVTNVETWPGRAEISLEDENIKLEVENILKKHGFEVNITNVSSVKIDGMTCHSCEIIIERKIKTIAGVSKVDVSAAGGVAKITCDSDCNINLEEIQKVIGNEQYKVRKFLNIDKFPQPLLTKGGVDVEKPSLTRLVGLFIVVFVLGFLFSKFGLFNQSFSVGNSNGLLSAILLGLVAGSSSCLAVAGGLMLSTSGKFHERYGNAMGFQKIKPVVLFVAGRVVAYGMFGGLIGLIGKSLTPSVYVTSGLTILAALYMLIMGLEMLKIAPNWLKSLMPRMPKRLGHLILDADGREHWSMSFMLGGATFFLPCGFTQSLQIYALTTGSFWSSALILGGFALGTSPALMALGWLSSSLKGKLGKWFFQFSGAVVVVLGLWNIQNGLTVAGYPLSLAFLQNDAKVTVSAGNNSVNDANVAFDGSKSLIQMKLGVNPAYSPSDEYTVRAGFPVRMEISGIGTGCRTVFQIPKLGVSINLNKPLNIAEFTPTKAGDYTFSCSMGMFRGVIRAL